MKASPGHFDNLTYQVNIDMICRSKTGSETLHPGYSILIYHNIFRTLPSLTAGLLVLNSIKYSLGSGKL